MIPGYTISFKRTPWTIAAAVAVLALIAYGIFNTIMQQRLRETGIKSKAVITDLWYGGSKGTRNYGYEYKYFVEKDSYGFHTYTRDGLNIGDTIIIYYDQDMVCYSRDSATVHED